MKMNHAKILSVEYVSIRSSHRICSVKKVVLKNFANFTGKNLCWSLFLIKLQFQGPATLLKKTSTKVLPCEICEPFKSNYFEEHLWMSTSKLYLKKESNIVFSCKFSELFKNNYLVKDLQTAGSETAVWGSLFNKTASLMAWRSLTVL